MKLLSKFTYTNNLSINDIIDSYLLFKKQKIKMSTYYRYQYIINKYAHSSYEQQMKYLEKL